MQSDIRLGFVGFGEVAYELGKGLWGEGLAGIAAWKRPSWEDKVRARAAEAHVDLREGLDELVRRSDVICSVVTASAATEVAEKAAPFLAGKIYVDLNSTSPMAKEKGAAAVTSAGGKFIDGAIMGALNVYHHKAPILLSGPDAEELAGLVKPWGMDVQVVGDRVGQASAIKMFRSVYMKGIEALVLETMMAASRYGVLDVVLASLAETHQKYDFPRLASTLVISNALSGERRAQEMEQVVLTLKELGIDPMASGGALERLRWSANLRLHEQLGAKPGHLDVLQAIEARTR